MHIVKLHTTTSTNEYLKEYIQKHSCKNFTVVTTKHQSQGKGQRGNSWHSEKDKNLLFSIFIEHNKLKPQQTFVLNQVISLGVFQGICAYYSNIKIKWPNDIMAESKKIAGILIENTVSNNKIKHSIVGIGINVNQENFPDFLPGATSLKKIIKKDINLASLLLKIVDSIQSYYKLFEGSAYDRITDEYLKNLYLINKESRFQNLKKEIFKGTINGITPEGKLLILVKGVQKEFSFKEVIFLD